MVNAPEIIQCEPLSCTVDAYYTFIQVPDNEIWKVWGWYGSNTGGGGNPKINNLAFIQAGKIFVVASGNSGLGTAASTRYEMLAQPIELSPKTAVQLNLDYDVGTSVAKLWLLISRIPVT